VTDTTSLPPRFDPAAPEVKADPYPFYAALRAAGPLCRAGPAQLGVTRYDEVAALLRDQRLRTRIPSRYHQVNVGDGAVETFFQRILTYRDPPHHGRLRRLMGQAMTAPAVRRLDDAVRSVVAELLEPLCHRAPFDVVSDLALPLPVRVICDLLGLPTGDHVEVVPRAAELSNVFAFNVGPEHRAAANAALEWLRRYVGELLEVRRRSPRDDLLSGMLLAKEGDDRMNHDEIVDNVTFLFFAGFETTMNMIATACAELLRRPDQLQRLRDDRSLATSAAEEALRYDAPIQMRARFVVEPVEVAGRVIRPGRLLHLLIGSANHDERRFEHPERFDIGRFPNPHLSFGGGIHHCLGAALARLEGRVALEVLVDRFAVLESAGDPTPRSDGGFRGFASVPVCGRPRA
jgi:cytochrome P450